MRQPAQRPNLVHQAGRDHVLDPRLDARIKLGARQLQAEHSGRAGRLRAVPGPGPFLLPGAERLAGQVPHFQGADDPPPVVGVQPRCGRGIDLGQALMENPGPGHVGFTQQTLAQLEVGRRTVKETPQQRFQIHRRAAGKEHAPAAPLDFLCTGCCLLEPPGDAAGFPGIEHVEQMVRHAPPQLRTRLGRADVHTAIDGHGVNRNDLRL